MIRRSTAIVLLVFIILLITAWYLGRGINSEPAEETITSTPLVNLFDLSADALMQVRIEETGAGQLVMEKDEQGIWSFIDPAGVEIDQDEAQSIAESVLSLNVLTKLEKPPALEVLGLDKPVYRIALTSRDGEEQETIVGNLTSTSSGYYVSRLGQIPVVVSKFSLDSILEKIENPPIYVTQTPTTEPQVIETPLPTGTP